MVKKHVFGVWEIAGNMKKLCSPVIQLPTSWAALSRNAFGVQGRIFRVSTPKSRSFRESPLWPLERVQRPARRYLKSSSRKVALFNVKAYIICSTFDGWLFGPGSERASSACDIIETTTKLYCRCFFIEKSLINLPLEFLDPKRIKSCVGTLDTRLGCKLLVVLRGLNT